MGTVNGTAGAEAPPLPMPPQSVPVFKEGIGLDLSRWWALNIAIENEWGGHGSRAIADQLSSDIFSWFAQSRGSMTLMIPLKCFGPNRNQYYVLWVKCRTLKSIASAFSVMIKRKQKEDTGQEDNRLSGQIICKFKGVFLRKLRRRKGGRD